MFSTRQELETFVTRFLWYIVFHVSVNYGVAPYATFVPITPTKLYKDTNPAAAKNFARVLPDAANTMVSYRMRLIRK